MLTALTLAAAALTPDWRYVAPSKTVAGGGPAAVRSADVGEPVLVTCQRDKSFVIIAAGPSRARNARLRTFGTTATFDLVRLEGGSSLLSVAASSPLLANLAGEWSNLTVAYDDGRRSTITPNEAVARVIRECRSLPN